MNKVIFYLLLMTYSIYSQVAPDYHPYSIINYDNKLFSNEIIFNGNKIDFIEHASVNLTPDYLIYRLTILFENIVKGNINITDWSVPKGAMLFILDNNLSYSGPYLHKHENSFSSARFSSNKLTFEYLLPTNSKFVGHFTINEIIDKEINFDFKSNDIKKYAIKHNRERPRIMVTGYWPPTNEMVRHFSQDLNLNPNGWQGGNWQGLGYDVVSFFPEFNPPDCNNCGQGFGDLEVDYQDYSQDFWPIVESVRPVGIITFSRGFNDMSWELENRVVNRTNWYEDYTSPFLPTPNPPDNTVANYHVRYISLPVDEIISAVFNAHLGIDAYLDNTNAGMFLSEFSGYHGVWYKEIYESHSDFPCFAAGHIHVGAQLEWNDAKIATEASIRALINYIDQFIFIQGDCNNDGEINVLDIVTISGYILGEFELDSIQIQAADMDNNNDINVLDIIAIVNLILS